MTQETFDARNFVLEAFGGKICRDTLISDASDDRLQSVMKPDAV